MRKEELLSDDFIKQFKTEEELYGFLVQLQKRGVKKDARRHIKCSFKL
jgi:putative transposase